MKIHDDRPRSVRGTVFSYDDFEVEVHLLGEHTLDRLPDEPLLIVRDHRHTEFHAGSLPNSQYKRRLMVDGVS